MRALGFFTALVVAGSGCSLVFDTEGLLSGGAGQAGAAGSGGEGGAGIGGAGGIGGEGGGLVTGCTPGPNTMIGSECGIFVAQDAAGNGSQESPTTFEQALVFAAGGNTNIYICGAFEREADATQLPTSVSIFAQLDCSTWTQDKALPQATFTGAADMPVFLLQGITTFQGVAVNAVDAVGPSASSIGIVLDNGALSLVDSSVVARNGSQGLDGITEDPGGEFSEPGQDANGSCGFSIPGSGGYAFCPGLFSSDGGQGGQGGSGNSGSAGQPGQGLGAGAGGTPQTAMGPCSNGQPGSEGPPGLTSPQLSVWGSMSAGGYSPPMGFGAPAGDGEPGGGGGGGGGGKSCSGQGPSGGGGGAGGCGGRGGSSGDGGGGSFGVLLVGASTLQLTGSKIQSGAGGPGGAGSKGLLGTVGTAGGAPSPSGSGAAACAGGAGGKGGDGGSGGGGPGGLSSAILLSTSASVGLDATSQLLPGDGGPAGTAAQGGPAGLKGVGCSQLTLDGEMSSCE